MKFTKPIVFFIILIGGFIPTFGQNFADQQHYLIDSLNLNNLSESDLKVIDTSLKDYHSALDDTSKIKALNYICENMLHDDWERYQNFQLKLILRSLNKPSIDHKVRRFLKLSLAGAYNNIGYINNIKGDIEISLDFFKKSAKIYNELDFKEGYAATINNIGYIYQKQGDIYNALEFYQKSLVIEEERNNKKGIATSLNNLGFVYNMLGDTTSGLDFYHRSLEIKKELGNEKGIASSFNNIGLVYSKLGNYGKALEYHQNSLELREKLKDSRGVAESYNNIGSIYRNEGKIDTALKYYQKSLSLKEKIDDKEGITYTLHNIAQVLLLKGEIEGPEGAFITAQKSLEISKELGIPKSISASAEILSKIYKLKGDYKNTHELYTLHIQMRDSLINEKNQRNAAKLQAKYAYEKQKVIDNKEFEKSIAIEQEAKEKQQIISGSVVMVLMLVLIFSIFIVNRLQITRKQKIIIQESNEELNQINEEIMAQRDQIEGQKNVIELKHNEIQNSISYAKRIQEAILPPRNLLSKFLPNHFVIYKPKDVVAGDFYWLELHDDIVFFAVADCTGHGVPGAMVSVVCHNALNRAVKEFELRETNQILDKVRELVVITFEKSEEQMKDGMDICLCAWNKKQKTLQFSGANNSLYYIQNHDLKVIKGTKQPIGYVDKPIPYESHKINLNMITNLYLTTDGFADQFGGPNDKKYGYQQLREMCVENYQKSMQDQESDFIRSIESWMKEGHEEQIDDICFMSVRLE